MIIITKNEKYLVSLLSATIRNIEPTPPKESIDWGKLFLIADSQNVQSLVYPAIDKLPNQYKPPLGILEIWRKTTMISVYNFAKQAQQLETISQAFENEKVQVIFLKGAVLRDLYPIPELRTMSDFDILVHRSDREKVKRIFNNLGYETKIDYPNSMEFKKMDFIKFEVFFELFATIKIDASDFTSDLWDNAISYKNNLSCVLKFKNEDFLLHIVSHLAKHLKGRGAGVRNLCDLVLYIETHSKNLNWDYVNCKIDSFGLKKFFNVLLIILYKHFNLRLIDNITISIVETDINSANRLLKHMLTHGVYGIPFEENYYLPQSKDIHASGAKMYIDYLLQAFPPIIKLSPRYSYAKKMPFLLLFAWIHRLIVIRNERKITLTDALKNIDSSNVEIKMKNDILKDLDLL